MIRVTLWYEYIQEAGKADEKFYPQGMSKEDEAGFFTYLNEGAKKIAAVYPEGLMAPIQSCLSAQEDIQVTSVHMMMEEFGLTDQTLDETDVLIWWAHISHDSIPDSLVQNIVERVNKGMGFIPLHSSHKSKPFMRLMGTSGCLKWREGDFCRIWTVDPVHPIAAGIPEQIELSEEEMYGEHFDIPRPDDIVFLSWFRGGEVFRSGCTWQRGYGKIFYFQPGHETSPSYHNEHVKQIILNAVRWAAPTKRLTELNCPNAIVAPEASK